MASVRFFIRLESAWYLTIAFLILSQCLVAIDIPLVTVVLVLVLGSGSASLWEIANIKHHLPYYLAVSIPYSMFGFILGCIWPLRTTYIKQIFKPILIRFVITFVLTVILAIIVNIAMGSFKDS